MDFALRVASLEALFAGASLAITDSSALGLAQLYVTPIWLNSALRLEEVDARVSLYVIIWLPLI
jgi:hypothetical protein